MNQDTTFVYKYSAKENKEVQEIRNKYLPREESKLEELKRLDYMVQRSGIIESLCFGIGGALVFGLGLCLAMQIIGNGIFMITLGVFLGIIGMCVECLLHTPCIVRYSVQPKKNIHRESLNSRQN